MQRLIIIQLFCLFQIVGIGQTVELISSDNSDLPENDIWSIEVDSTGTKWFGTAKSGLIAYRNGEFKIYNDSTSNFRGSYIGPLFSDSKNKLWITAAKPNALYVFENDTFIKIENDILKSLGSIIAIAENEYGVIYFGGSNGVIKFESDKWTKLSLPLKNITVRTLAVNKKGDLAIGLNEGLIIRKENDFKVYKANDNELQLSVVRGLKYIDNDKLIIGYGGGFGKGGFSIKEGKKWTHYNRENSKIANHMVRDIEVDSENTFWMATNEGLSYYKEGNVDTAFFREGRMKNTIMDVAIFKDEIWVATNFGIIQIKK